MRDHHTYDYAVIRVVPRVEREEFMNAGVILSCPDLSFLAARVHFDDARMRVLDAGLDVDAVRAQLETIVAVAAGGAHAGPIGTLPQRQRFHWLVAPRSTIVQTSTVHSGWCVDPDAVLDRLLGSYVPLRA